jgi:hypothetical protein
MKFLQIETMRRLAEKHEDHRTCQRRITMLERHLQESRTQFDLQGEQFDFLRRINHNLLEQSAMQTQVINRQNETIEEAHEQVQNLAETVRNAQQMLQILRQEREENNEENVEIALEMEDDGYSSEENNEE